jgi:hypothetical protein
MADASSGLPVKPPTPQLPPAIPDTTAASVVHVLPNYFDRIDASAFIPAVLYLVAVAITCVPLLIGAWISGELTLADAHQLRFLRDGSVMFMFLVSFPCMLILTATDQQLLAGSLRTVSADGTLTMPGPEWVSLADRWRRRFRKINRAAQAFGLVLGIVVAYYNCQAYAKVGHWIANKGVLLPVGWVYLYCVFLFYAVAAVYLVRNFAIAVLLQDIAKPGWLNILPLHPDRACGLLPVGRLGLRNQYALTLLGLNLVLLIITYSALSTDALQIGLIVAATVGYLILGPLAFVAPLLPFRRSMVQTKDKLMAEVALWSRAEFEKLDGRLQSGMVTAEDAELIKRSRKIGTLAAKLPVWPFDAGTISKFLTAYVLPVASSVAIPAAQAIAKYLGIPTGGS